MNEIIVLLIRELFTIRENGETVDYDELINDFCTENNLELDSFDFYGLVEVVTNMSEEDMIRRKRMVSEIAEIMDDLKSVTNKLDSLAAYLLECELGIE